MKYKFPIIETIDDVLPSIHGREEFKVMDKGDYIVIDYVYVMPDSFDDIMRRECRGIVFNSLGRLISRPFHKFFNLGEKPETQPDQIDFSRPHQVMIKADGSLIRPALIKGELVPMTRKGITDVAIQAFNESMIDSESQWDMVSWIKSGYTPLYEFVSPNNKIVVNYPIPRLIFLGARENRTGKYYNGYGVHPDIQTTLKFNHASALQDHVKNVKEEIEGYVVRFNNGHMIKIKTEEYLRLHKVIDVFDSEKDILKIVLNGQADDLYPNLTEAQKEKFSSYEKDVLYVIKNLSDGVEKLVNSMSDASQKEFAAGVQNMIGDTRWHSIYYKTRQTGDAFWVLKEFILKYCATSTKLNEIKKEFCLPEWKPTFRHKDD